MATFAVTYTGTPIYPLTIGIEAGIDVSQAYSQEVTIEQVPNTPAFDAIVHSVVDSSENAFKTLAQFTTQDTTRNGQATYTHLGNNIYRIDMSWTIENAVIGLEKSLQSDLQGTDLDDYLQSVADSEVVAFKTQWTWVDL